MSRYQITIRRRPKVRMHKVKEKKAQKRKLTKTIKQQAIGTEETRANQAMIQNQATHPTTG